MAVTTATRRSAKGRKHAPSKKPKKKRGFFRRFWWVFVLVPVLGAVGVFGTLAYIYSKLTLPETPPPVQTTYVYDSDGELIMTLHAAVDRTVIPLKDMPMSLRNAVIATEDHDFYKHPGIDPLGIARAAWNDLRGNPVQGGSTITQQLVKNVYAGQYQEDPDTGEKIYVVPPRTFGQKVREALLAIKLEQEYSKDQILAKYLNTIYFGHGAYGVQAAAETYFQDDAKELTMLESATLAGMIANPAAFGPIDHPWDARYRRNLVFDRLVDSGYLEAERAAQLKEKDPVHVAELSEIVNTPGKSEYFFDYVKRELIKTYTGAATFGGGLEVTTTIDMDLQGAAEDAVAANLDTPGDPEAAVVAIDPSTGAVKAMYGGSSWARSKVNLALTGAKGYAGTGRQAGSAFKPFTLATAMEQKYSLNAYWSGPGTITIPDKICYTDGKPWTLSNASDSEAGTFSLAKATAYSVNTVFAQLAAAVGPENVVDVAHRLGIRSKLEPVCSITLGTQAVNPLEMTNAYATLAARGTRRYATPIQEVEGPDGTVLPGGIADVKAVQAISRNDADLVTYALEGVISGGTGTAASIGRPAAGKTGTAQEYVDAWFCGYTPQLATCVWVGYPAGEIPLQNVEGYSAVFGGTIPANIWHDFMTEAMAGVRIRDFATPSFEGYTEGPVRPVPSPSPSPSKSPKPSPSPSESPSPSPSPSPSLSPSPSPTPSETPSPTPTEAPGFRAVVSARLLGARRAPPGAGAWRTPWFLFLGWSGP